MLYAVDLNTWVIKNINMSDIDIYYHWCIEDDGYAYVDYNKDSSVSYLYINMDFDFNYYYISTADIIIIKDKVILNLRNNKIDEILK